MLEKQQRANSQRKTEEEKTQRKTTTVLIIDDDTSITRTFARILQKKGYQTETAHTGKEAIQKANAKSYDVALIDICLPDMNGTKLLDKLKDDGRKMVKIVITGFPSMAPKKSIAADAYLVKPVKPADVLAVIEQKIRKNSV